MGAYSHQNAVGHGPAEQNLDGIDRDIEEVDILVESLVGLLNSEWNPVPGVLFFADSNSQKLALGGVIEVSVTARWTDETIKVFHIVDGHIETQMIALYDQITQARTSINPRASLACITI